MEVSNKTFHFVIFWFNNLEMLWNKGFFELRAFGLTMHFNFVLPVKLDMRLIDRSTKVLTRWLGTDVWQQQRKKNRQSQIASTVTSNEPKLTERQMIKRRNRIKREQQCTNTRNKLLLSLFLAITARLPEKCFLGNQRTVRMATREVQECFSLKDRLLQPFTVTEPDLVTYVLVIRNGTFIPWNFLRIKEAKVKIGNKSLQWHQLHCVTLSLKILIRKRKRLKFL